MIADRFPWLCAIWLHLVLYALATDAASWRLPTPPPPEPIDVEILPSTARRPTVAPVPVPPDPASPLEDRAQPDVLVTPARPANETINPTAPTWVRATTFLAADVLSDPRSRQARAALATLTGADSREQVCALEAMEQLRHDSQGFRPTRLAPHAFRNAIFKDGVIQVTAGAVRSNRVWYEIAYRCRFDAGGQTVIGFEYALGAPVDRALWDEYGLAPIH